MTAVGNCFVGVLSVNVDEVNRPPQVVPVPFHTEEGHQVADIIFPGPETEEGREMERDGTEGTAVKEMTDNKAVAEKYRGGETRRVWQVRPPLLSGGRGPGVRSGLEHHLLLDLRVGGASGAVRAGIRPVRGVGMIMGRRKGGYFIPIFPGGVH